LIRSGYNARIINKKKENKMKKTYINPQMEIVKVATQQMLAASGDLDLQSGSASEWGAREDDGDFDW